MFNLKGCTAKFSHIPKIVPFVFLVNIETSEQGQMASDLAKFLVQMLGNMSAQNIQKTYFVYYVYDNLLCEGYLGICNFNSFLLARQLVFMLEDVMDNRNLRKFLQSRI